MSKAQYIKYRFKTRPEWQSTTSLTFKLAFELNLDVQQVVNALVEVQ